MPLSTARRLDLTSKLPAADITRQRIAVYMAKAEITREVFAKAIGYSEVALREFLFDRYTVRHAKTDLLIREAAEQYMEVHSLEPRAMIGHLYETENVREMRHWFEFCHKHRALAFVYGPPGSQKTYVFESLISEFTRREMQKPDSINRAYYVRASINSTPRDLLAKFCAAAGAPAYMSIQRCMGSLRFHLRDTSTVFVLDEAQLCGIPALEAIRELHDIDPRIGCLLAGSHGLRQFFDQHAAELEQWNSRLEAGVELGGVSDDCARAILMAELPGLDDDQIADMINGSRAQDAYSRNRQGTYLNMRRLFKNIAAVRRLNADSATGASA